MKIRLANVLLVIVALSLAGCAGGPPLRDYSLSQVSAELSATPFFPQDEYQCGPAALATVLGASGLAIAPEALTPHIYIPGRRGSLQEEVVAATRRHGRIPYVLRPSLDDLLTEITAGMPVLVMQNLGLKRLPQWHYAVVIGYDVPSDSLLLRSGREKRLRMRRTRFEDSWWRAGNWAMVTAMPGEPPATAQPITWLRAASAFEELDQPHIAVEAYGAATRRWPEQAVTWLALANARYAQGDLPGAEKALRHSVQLAPSAAAHNNLAHVLRKQGSLTEAAAQIRLAATMPDAEALGTALTATRIAIEEDTGRGTTAPALEIAPRDK